MSNHELPGALAHALAHVPSEYFHDEAVLRIRWSTDKFVAEDEAIVVPCPDFTEDVNHWVRDLSLALSVDAQQVHVLSLAGVATGAPALFNEKVIYTDGVFESTEPVAQRTEPGRGAITLQPHHFHGHGTAFSRPVRVQSRRLYCDA